MTETVPLEIRKDPRIAAAQADLDAQFDLLLKIRDQLTRTSEGINRLRDVRTQIEAWEKRIEGREDAADVRTAATDLKKTLTEIEEELIQVRSKALEDPLNFPVKLNNKLATLSGAVASADTAPTRQAYAVYDDLTTKIGLHLITLSTVVETDVAEFNQLVSRLSIPAIMPRRE
jgi:phage-related tail protein